MLIITGVGTGNGDLGNVSVTGYGNAWRTPILLTDNPGNTIVVFCDDLNHDVLVGGAPLIRNHAGEVRRVQNLLVFDAAPKPFDEHIVLPDPLPAMLMAMP